MATIDKGWYFFTQQTDGKCKWENQLAEMKDQILQKLNPMYCTVLEVDRIIDENYTPADKATTSYRGPFYLDWDAEHGQADGPMSAVAGALRFIGVLESGFDVPPTCLKIYLTGGRGVHVEIPQAVFWSGKTGPERGLPYLYAVYGAMAMRLATPCMDLRIYSGKKGRQWRRPNVQRDNGRFKVQISYKELQELETVEQYNDLCSEPRPALQVAAPEPSPRLSMMFAECRNEVESRFKAKKISAADLKVFEAYRDSRPPTVDNVLQGIGVDHGKGWNQICLQVAVMLIRLGLRDSNLALIEIDNLLRAHIAVPGVSHNSYESAAEHFRQIFDYVQSTHTYEYSKGAFQSILTDKAKRDGVDLDGMLVSRASDGELVAAASDLSEEEAAEALLESLRLQNTPAGIVKQGKEGPVLSLKARLVGNSVGISTSVETPDETFIDFTMVDEFNTSHTVELSKKGLVTLEAQKEELLVPTGIYAPDFDQKAAADFGAMVRTHAHRNIIRGISKVTKNIPWEGLNVLRQDDGTYHVFWAAGSGMIYRAGEELDYRFGSVAGGSKGLFKTNITDVPQLSGTVEEREVINALLNMNGNAHTMGTMIAWFVGTFIRPFVMTSENQWPLLNICGQQGTGKTTTVDLIQHLFYHGRPPSMLSASSNQTEYGMASMFACSNTIPIVMDEVKEKSMNPAMKAMVNGMLHNAYTVPYTVRKGGGGGRGGSWAKIGEQQMRAPLVYLGEFHGADAAVQERSVVANFELAGKAGRAGFVDLLKARRTPITSLGHSLLRAALDLDVPSVPATVLEHRRELEAKFPAQAPDRVLYNVACMITSLEFLREVLEGVFGTVFNDKIDTFIAALADPANNENAVVKTELVQVLETLAYFTTVNKESPYHIKEGRHYAFSPDGAAIDINIGLCFDAYLLYCQQLGVAKALPSSGALRGALRHCDLEAIEAPIGSDLGDGDKLVWRINLAKLNERSDIHFTP